jgi:predicted Zn-dependent protease with MMP-like domain
MIYVTEEEFQGFIDNSFESIPGVFKEKLENLVFIVEDYPSKHDLERLGLKHREQLLGLYSGTPYTYRNTSYMGTIPDRIILFQKNIESICSSVEELKNKVREVIIHEIAHYFGMSEKEIRNAGY